MAPIDEEALIDRIAVAVAAKLGVPAAPVRAGLTWRALWTDHYAPAERDKLDSWDTVEGRAKHVLRHIGDDLVIDGGVNTVRKYRGKRREETTVRKGPPSKTTINREIELILRMARWASRQKPPLIPGNPFAGIERDDLFDALENVRLNVVEDDPTEALSLARLLEDAEPFDRAIVLVAHSSGMRRAELARLERTWVDRRQRIVTIPPGVSKGRRGKRRGRQTFISVEALEAIDAYHETLPFPWRYKAVHVFVNKQTGGPYSKGHFTVRFRKLAERKEFVGPSGPVWLHDAGRRSFITLHRRRGEDTSNIMKASGHRTLKAFERYDIHSRKDAIVVRDRIEAARAKELAEIAEARRGPQRAPGHRSADETFKRG